MAIAVKKHAKVDIKLFLPCPILLDSLINTKYPVWDCRYPQIKQFFGKFNMASYLDLTMMPQLSYIILLIFDALLIWVLSRFVVRMIIKSANGKQWTQKKRRESKIRKKLQFENTILVPWIFLEPFAILATFQNLVIITMSTLRPWTMHDVRFSSAD